MQLSRQQVPGNRSEADTASMTRSPDYYVSDSLRTFLMKAPRCAWNLSRVVKTECKTPRRSIGRKYQSCIEGASTSPGCVHPAIHRACTFSKNVSYESIFETAGGIKSSEQGIVAPNTENRLPRRVLTGAARRNGSKDRTGASLRAIACHDATISYVSIPTYECRVTVGIVCWLNGEA